MFDKEMWSIVKDEGPEVYADCLPNKVTVISARGTKYDVYIKVPSDLFKYLKDVQKVSREDLQKSRPVLYLIYDAGVHIFGIDLNDLGPVDLWLYKDVPSWAMKLNDI